MKIREELNAPKEEDETLNKKFHKLSDGKLEKVNGGTGVTLCEKYWEKYCCNCGYVYIKSLVMGCDISSEGPAKDLCPACGQFEKYAWREVEA